MYDPLQVDLYISDHGSQQSPPMRGSARRNRPCVALTEDAAPSPDLAKMATPVLPSSAYGSGKEMN